MAGKKNANESYIFLGPETGKKKADIDLIRKKLAEVETPEATVFYAGETTAIQIASAIQNHSLFAQTRLFLIKNAEQIKKKDEIASIAACMSGMEPGTAVILISDETKLAAGLDSLCQKENRRVFYELFENEKSEKIRSLFREEGRRIDADGIEAILELVENNSEAIQRECSRLMLFLPKDRPASAEDIGQWLSHNRQESAFTLFSRIAAGDTQKAIETLHTLLETKEPIPRLLAGIASCFKKLRDYQSLAGKGQPDYGSLKSIGIFTSKSREDYASAARRYSPAAVDACLALNAEYDILIRASGAMWESMLMDVYILKTMNS